MLKYTPQHRKHTLSRSPADRTNHLQIIQLMQIMQITQIIQIKQKYLDHEVGIGHQPKAWNYYSKQQQHINRTELLL